MNENEQTTEMDKKEVDNDLYDKLVEEELIKNGGIRYVW